MARDRIQSRDVAGTTQQAFDAGNGPVILAIGDVGLWRENGGSLPADGNIHFAEFHALTEDLLEALRPDVVLSPLLAEVFDCIDLASRLSEIGFGGRYRAMAPRLPNPEIVRRELQNAYPSLDFDIVSFAERDQLGRP